MTLAPIALLSLAACQSPDPSAADAGLADAALPIDAGVDAAIRIDAGLLPDLTVNVDRARVDLAVRQRTFASDACELDPAEDCIAEPGDRRLLHFSVETPNIGTADMVLGPPNDTNGQFAYSDCHGHYHFEGYAEYRLLDTSSNEVAVGRKQAFCLLDSERYVTDDPSVAASPVYGCDFQGIQRGWSDVYHSRLPCQFIDITGLADGAYALEISINNGGALPELTMDNNLVTVPVVIGSPEIAAPTEACPGDASPHSTDGLNRECGWTDAGVVECTPGEEIHVGCAATCAGIPLGSCTGDPMIRVCDAARPDGNCSYPGSIESDDDSCGGQCPVAAATRCPESGKLMVFTAPFHAGAAFSCDVAAVPAN